MSTLFHPWAWLAWTAGVGLTAVLTRNPLYLAILMAGLLVDWMVLSEGRTRERPWSSLLRVAIWIAAISTAFNALVVHEGRVVLFRLPTRWPVIGGPITGEAVLYGFTTGLSLVTLVTLFAVFQLEMPPSQWLRVIPGFLYVGGVVTAIGIAFVPATWRAAQDIYDAQRLRGHRFRRVWDYWALVTPLLVDSLERSLQLAEAMTVRGFGAHLRPWSSRTQVAVQLGLWLCLAGLASGAFLRAYWPAQPAGTALLWVSSAGLLLLFHMQGRRVKRSRYRRWYWRHRDTALLCGGILLLLTGLGTRLLAPHLWFYYPYPPYPFWPEFRWFPGGMLVLAALPAWIAGISQPTETANRLTGQGERP